MVMSKLYPVANIDLAAVQYNLQRVKQLAPNSRVMSVIKANAYGHGIIQISQALSASDALAVARLSEAIQLRDAGIRQDIVILEGVNTAIDLQLAADYSLSPVFHNALQIELVITISLNKPLEFCWLMVETGMHRLGISADQVDKALQDLTQSENISGSVGLMSHFANSDLINDPRNQQQLDTLLHCAKPYSLPISMANSAAILSFEASHNDWVRPGLMLYGASPFADQSASDLGLKPAMKLSSELIAIDQLQAGDQVGYGGDWAADKPTRIGIVSIGYGDGYSRQLSNKGTVLINGKCVVVVGRVSMDMIAIDLSMDTNAKVGDEVTLWGDDILTVDQVAQQANTISYELLCQISERVTRQYHG